MEIEKLGDDPKNKSQLAALKKQTVALTVESLKVITRASSGVILSSWGVPNSITKSISKLINKLLFGTLEHNAEEKFNAHLNLKKNIEEYQTQLKQILTYGNSNESKKIVFFVDELDRCRPNFAIEVIEKIKHLFSIENVFFVLAINKQQLMEIIRHSYGINKSNADIYLQKFIHVETKLPALKYSTNAQDTINVKIRNFVDQLIGLHKIGKFFNGRNEAKIALINLLASFKDPTITPRTIERVFSLITVALGSSEGSIRNDSQIFNILCNMAVLKVSAPHLYEKWKSGKFEILIMKDNQQDVAIFHQLESNFPNKEKNKQNHGFVVKKTDYVCGILDIYTFYKKVNKSVSMSYNG